MPATTPPARRSFKAQMLAAREDAIVEVVNRLLAEKGFDAMTVDEVASEVGIAKASLYKHFPSKEDLACTAMTRAMKGAQAFLAGLDHAAPPLDNLRATVRWVLKTLLAGQMPSLPSQNSSLRAALLSNRDYMDGLMEVSDVLGGWIEAAQSRGQINPALPAIVVLYTLYARACDPVVEFLRIGGQFTDEQIVDWIVSTCFDGIAGKTA